MEVLRRSAFFWTLAGLAVAAACGGRSTRIVADGDAEAGARAVGGTSGGATGGVGETGGSGHAASGGTSETGGSGHAASGGASATGGDGASGGDGNATGGVSVAGIGGIGAGGNGAGRSATGGAAGSGRGGASGGDAGDGAGGAPEPPDTLVPILEGGPWDVEQQTTGIAVDSHGTIYVSDAEHVFRVEGSSVFVHLDLDDLASATGLDDAFQFQDLDIDAYDTLYVAAGGMLLTSFGAHELELWGVFDADATLQSRAHVGVIGQAHVLVVDDEGLKEVTDEGPVSRYGVKALERTADCATEDLATTPAGVFLYQAGCDESPLLRGYAAGVGVDLLYRAGLPGSKPISASNFVCSARDPAGGFYVVTRQATGFAPILYHVNENASPNDDARYVPTTPSIASQQMLVWEDPLAFYFCSIAVAPDRSIVYQTYSQLWRITP